MANILIVDDDPFSVKLIAKTLERCGHKSQGISDPHLVMETLKCNHFDAVILDVLMPGVTGWDLLQKMRETPWFQSLPVVMVSSLNDAQHRIRGIRLGADDFQVKPFVPEELVARLERLIKNRENESTYFQGHLESYSIVELVQSLVQFAKTGMLEINAPTGSGEIRLVQGRMQNAVFGGLNGVAAAAAILELNKGSFRFKNIKGDMEIGEGSNSLDHLLMEAAWVEDEFKRRKRYFPPPDRRLKVVKEIEEVPGDFKIIPIEEVYSRLKMTGDAGFTLRDLYKERITSPNRLFLAVCWLVEHRIVGAFKA